QPCGDQLRATGGINRKPDSSAKTFRANQPPFSLGIGVPLVNTYYCIIYAEINNSRPQSILSIILSGTNLSPNARFAMHIVLQHPAAHRDRPGAAQDPAPDDSPILFFGSAAKSRG